MNYIEKYSYELSEEKILSNLEGISRSLESMNNQENLKACFAAMDLTTLHPQDTVAAVEKLVDKVNTLGVNYPSYPLPASVCVFSNFAGVVKDARKTSDLHVTVVSACFPTSQSFLEVKLLECRMAVEAGADEVDIVLALNAFVAGDTQAAFAEIAAVRKTIDAAAQGRKVILKVILETGVLKTAELIAQASFLAMEAGADFIKTSTGKVDVNATPLAAFVMCECIKAFYEKTGRKVGFKAAGGISTAQDALCYLSIVKNVLGDQWLGKDLFRLGVSRLGNALISAAEQKTVTYF